MARRVTHGSMGLRLEVHSSRLARHIGRYIDLVTDEPIGVLRQNTVAAVLISADDYERFHRLKDAFIATGNESERSRAWHDQEKASRLETELSQPSKESGD